MENEIAIAHKIAREDISDEEKMKKINEFSSDRAKYIIAKTLTSDRFRLDFMLLMNNPKYKLFIRRSLSSKFILENIEEILKNDSPNQTQSEISRKINSLLQMYKDNKDILYNINFKILDEKYIEQLGEDKINLITCYSKTQKAVLSLNDNQLKIFSACINLYQEKNDTEEWQHLATKILHHIFEYDELISNIGDINNLNNNDVAILMQIISNENRYNIKEKDELRKYNEVVQEHCNTIIQSEETALEEKKDALFQKIFGHDLKFAYDIINRFGVDNDNLHECEMKDYVRCLQSILEIDDVNVIREIFNDCEYVQIDTTYIERQLKNEYAMTYDNILYVPKEEDLVEGETNVYNAGTNFYILTTTLGAQLGERYAEDYNNDWNRPYIDSQFFCASLSRNDMIGVYYPTEQKVCFGFSKIPPDSLMFSGPNDINAFSNELMPSSRQSFNGYGERYLTPEEQINQTSAQPNISSVHNEIDIRRTIEGERIQPDYIVVFKENDSIINMEESRKASEEIRYTNCYS